MNYDINVYMYNILTDICPYAFIPMCALLLNQCARHLYTVTWVQKMKYYL